MNFGQHVFIGWVGTFFVVFVLNGLQFNMEPNFIIFVGIFSFVGSSLPDILEPAKHGRHRKRFHSKKTLYSILKVSGVIFIFMLIQVVIGFGVNITFVVFAFPFSYALHLVADSTTPAGLPDV